MRRFSTQPSVEEAQSDVMSEKSSRHRRRRSTRATSVRSDRSEETKVSKRKSMKREEPIELIKKEAEGEGNVRKYCNIRLKRIKYRVIFCQIQLEVIKAYARAGGLGKLVVVLIFHLLFLLMLIYGQIWLSFWADDPQDLPPDEQKELRNIRLGSYGGIVAIQSRSFVHKLRHKLCLYMYRSFTVRVQRGI